MDGGGGRRTPPEPERERDPDGAVDADGGGDASAGPESAAGTVVPSQAKAPAPSPGSGPPAHWLEHIRARAPHLLGPGGLAGDPVGASEAPASWPHGPDAVPKATYDVGDVPPRGEAAYTEIEPRALGHADVAARPEPRAPASPPEATVEAPRGRPEPPSPVFPPLGAAPAAPTPDWPDAPLSRAAPEATPDAPPGKVHPEPVFPEQLVPRADRAPDYGSSTPRGRRWHAWPRLSVAGRPEPPEGPAWGTGSAPRPGPAAFPALERERVGDRRAWGTPTQGAEASEPRYVGHDAPWAPLLEPDTDDPPDWRVLERRLARRVRLDREQRGR